MASPIEKRKFCSSILYRITYRTNIISSQPSKRLFQFLVTPHSQVHQKKQLSLSRKFQHWQWIIPTSNQIIFRSLSGQLSRQKELLSQRNKQLQYPKHQININNLQPSRRTQDAVKSSHPASTSTQMLSFLFANSKLHRWISFQHFRKSNCHPRSLTQPLWK